MAEPTSSAVSAGVTMGAVAFTAMLPGINGDALIGAFAGAVVFAMHAQDLAILKRLVYMVVSVLIGYLGAGEVITHTWVTSPVIAGFGLSAVIVTLTLATIDRIRNFDMTRFWKRG